MPAPAYPTVYAAFSMMDGTFPNPSGWIFGFDAHDLSMPNSNFPLIYATTPGPGDASNRHGGGVWQGGGGLALGDDESGVSYIYFSTADGQFNASNSNYGDSFLKLTTSLVLSDYFTPSDAFYRWDLSCATNGNDLDFGSGGVTLIPDGIPTSNAHLAVKGDKEGGIWAIDRTSPGEYGGPCNPPCGQCMNNNNVQTLWPMYKSHSAFFHNGGAYWNSSLYFAGSGSGAGKGNTLPLTQFPLCQSTTSPICGTSTPSTVQFNYGATPSVSSNGNNNGIVWAVDDPNGYYGGSNAAVLHAFNASNVATELYNSGQCGTADVPGPATKFTVATVANGNVFIGTQTDFDIYGVLATRNCN